VENANIPNTTEDQRKEYFAQARELGREKGKGDKSLVSFYQLAAKGAASGVFDVSKTKGEDDHAAQLYNAYAASYGKQESFGSVGVQASKVRAFIRLGLWNGQDGRDGLHVFERAMAMWTDARKAEISADSKAKSSMNSLPVCLAAVATNQAPANGTPRTTSLTDDEIRELFARSDAERDEAFYIKQAVKQLEHAEKLNSGREETGNAKSILKRVLLAYERDAERAKIAEELGDMFSTFSPEQVEALVTRRLEVASK